MRLKDEQIGSGCPALPHRDLSPNHWEGPRRTSICLGKVRSVVPLASQENSQDPISAPRPRHEGPGCSVGTTGNSSGDDAAGGWLLKCFLVEAEFPGPPYVPCICLATCLQTGSGIYAQGG